MATKIPTEIVIKILNNVQSTRDLYSSLLVNRIWCRAAIPILWELTLCQKCYMGDKKLRQKALCIRTYLSCLNTQARTLLIQDGFDLSSSPPRATFDYPSFTHKLIINNLVYFISIYSPQIIVPYQGNYKKNEITITKLRILFREICKLLIHRCSFLDYFKLSAVPKKFRNYDDLICSILKLPGAPKLFKKLKSFTSIISDDDKQIYPLYESLKLICDNILNMDLELNSYSQARLLAKLISVQKRLENLSIVGNGVCPNSIFWAIISQKETLKSLRLKSVNFYCFKMKSSPIGQFISLQELYIEDCCGMYKSDCSFLASSFTKLSSINCFRLGYMEEKHSQEFIGKILETANNNLRNIYLDLNFTIPSKIFSAILNYCTKIIKLTLSNLSPKQIIAIFNNNFNELRSFSFDCGRKRFDANELLCQIAKNVPESLETIEIRMGIFSSKSLRKFFEGWCCKGGGNGNKKIIVERTEQARLFTLSNEHFKVIKEYGVQFYIEE